MRDGSLRKSKSPLRIYSKSVRLTKQAMNQQPNSLFSPSRRTFLKQSATVAIGVAAAPITRLRAASSPGNKLRVGVVGLGRGSDHVKALLQIENVEVAYIAEVDEARLAKGAKLFQNAERQPKAVKDFRCILEDKEIDAITIATPNHWHAAAAILACSDWVWRS